MLYAIAALYTVGWLASVLLLRPEDVFDALGAMFVSVLWPLLLVAWALSHPFA